jgi:hypothetical protein
MRKEFEMSQADFDKLMEACKLVPYIVIGGQEPRSRQENANQAWKELGERMGFDHLTVKPSFSGPKYFTAEVQKIPFRKIYKYSLVMGKTTELTVPDGMLVRHVHMRESQVCMWAEVQPYNPEITRRFVVLATGDTIPRNAVYLGTCMDGPFVWHVFEKGVE